MNQPSFWFSQLNEVPKRNSLSKNLDTDVVIIGAGFTGLWTAYYLKKLSPHTSVVIIEKNHVGFGASGRNGGWCSALFATSLEKLAKKSSPQLARQQYLEMVNTLDEIEAVMKIEKIEADWQRGGTVTLARDQIQLKRAAAEVNHFRDWGFDEDYLRLLSKNEASELLAASKVLGGTFTPHCAAINPAKLVIGLAQAVENLGVEFYENTPVTDFFSHFVKTTNFSIKAKYVVRATEGYTPTFKNHKRDLIPVYSLMIATEPLPPGIIEEVGLEKRTTFADFRNTIIYGQRTLDNRIAFGGRGAPYPFGSRIRPSFEQHAKTHRDLEKTLKELLPQIKNLKITDTWGGPLGIPRDWSSHVGLDPKTGLASAGGYVGDGVGTSNLAGRTLADLILKRDSEITKLPWVNHKSKKWEVEPFRFIGVNLGTLLAKVSDRFEKGKSKPTIFTKLFNYLLDK